MNKKGFTLIEILAVIVIIGIVATIGIVSISSSVLKSRDASVVDLAKVHADAARTMRARDDFFYEPKSGEAIIIPYSQVTGAEIENKDVTGYGSIIDYYCYIGVVNDNNKFKYYITQVDDSYHILDRVEYNLIDEDKILQGSNELSENNVKALKAPLTGFSIKYGNTDYNIKGVRIKYTATSQEGNNVSLYGYYTSDNSYVSTNAHIKGNISLYDTFKSSGASTLLYKSKTYTVVNSEIMYIILTSN